MSAGGFDDVIDKYRCRSVGGGRRCQLIGHEVDVDHAAAWSDPKPLMSYRRGSGVVARQHWIRWDDAGVVREQEPGSERLPWCSMGSV
jgi:hypothetical protein